MSRKRSKIIEHLNRLEEYKKRVKAINVELYYLRNSASGAQDYTQPAAKSSNISDPIFRKAYDAIDKNFDEIEKRLKAERAIANKLIEQLEIALSTLNTVKNVEQEKAQPEDYELEIIKAKYLIGKVRKDKSIFNTGTFPYGKTKYYEVRKKALDKIEKNIGDLIDYERFENQK